MNFIYGIKVDFPYTPIYGNGNWKICLKSITYERDICNSKSLESLVAIGYDLSKWLAVKFQVELISSRLGSKSYYIVRILGRVSVKPTFIFFINIIFFSKYKLFYFVVDPCLKWWRAIKNTNVKLKVLSWNWKWRGIEMGHND